MKEVFFIGAIILAFIATFISIETTADGRNWRFGINFFAGSFLCYLLSQAPFIS